MKNKILPAVRAFLRYGKPTPLNEISLRTQAVQRDYEVIIYPDRATAIAAAARLRRPATGMLKKII